MRELEEAANKVMRAMRSLDAHRHDGAPTLEREYRQALEAYFATAERALGRDSAQSESEDDDTTELAIDLRAREMQRDVSSVAGHYAAARRALRLARIYRHEPGTSGRRERECIQAALRHREEIRALRLRLRPAAEQLQLPGLAKTRPEAASTRRVAQTG